MVAIDNEYVMNMDEAVSVRPGIEVAIIPPVSGGWDALSKLQIWFQFKFMSLSDLLIKKNFIISNYILDEYMIYAEFCINI